MIDGHGDDLWRYGNKVKHNFSSNISAFDHTRLMKYLAEAGDAVSCYPEPSPLSVEKAIAEINSVGPEEVMVTNGATEAIYLLAQTCARCQSAILAPTFREYQDACKIHGHTISFISSLSTIPKDSQLVWLCNPNNPTGNTILKEKLIKTARSNPGKVFIVDQAYADYTLMETLSAREAVSAGNIILLGSMTKRFAIPGLRIGYAIGNSALLDRVKAWRMPWSVNGLAIKAALFMIEHAADYEIDATGLHAEALRIAKAFTEMGIRVWPTDCNFILCELPDRTASELKEYLINTVGILIRDASNFEGLGQRHFRVAAQTPEENNLLIKGIRQWFTR